MTVWTLDYERHRHYPGLLSMSLWIVLAGLTLILEMPGARPRKELSDVVFYDRYQNESPPSKLQGILARFCKTIISDRQSLPGETGVLRRGGI